MPQLPPDIANLCNRVALLEAENLSLQALNRDLESFLHAVAHDLRSPLRTIAGFCQRLQEALADPLAAAMAHDLAGIQTAVGRMQSLLTRWLSLARSGSAELQREPVDLSVIARSLCDDLQVAEPDRRVQLSIADHLIADADPVLARELLQNLIDNAWKFTRHTQPAVVEIGAHSSDGETTFFVRDNGAGIDPENAHKLFRPFEPLHGDQRFAGSGVGLSIARRIVERHHGKIWANGFPRRGTTIFFTLPKNLPH